MKYSFAWFFIGIMVFIGTGLLSQSNSIEKINVVLESHEGGKVTDGADIRIIEWEKHQTGEKLVLYFYDREMSETIEPGESPCLYSIQKELYPYRLIITLSGARSLSAEFPDITDSIFIKDFYELMVFDDSIRSFAVTLNKPAEIMTAEFQDPGRLVIEFGEGSMTDLVPVYSLRTGSQKAGEWLLDISEFQDIRVIKDTGGLFFAELGCYAHYKEAESEMEKYSEGNYFIEERGPYDIPDCLIETEMTVIRGRVTDFNGTPVSNALIDVKNSDFTTAHRSYSNDEGYYSVRVKKGKYTGLFAMDINEYPRFSTLPLEDQRLEFWAWNLIADRDKTIDIRYHRLEIYGVNVFNIQGAYPGYTIYFRPMSLSRIFSGMEDMAPQPDKSEIEVDINGFPVNINHIQRVEEFVGEAKIYGYLLHVDLEEIENDKPYNVFRIQMKDLETGDMGEALYYHEKPDYY